MIFVHGNANQQGPVALKWNVLHENVGFLLTIDKMPFPSRHKVTVITTSVKTVIIHIYQHEKLPQSHFRAERKVRYK